MIISTQTNTFKQAWLTNNANTENAKAKLNQLFQAIGSKEEIARQVRLLIQTDFPLGKHQKDQMKKKILRLVAANFPGFGGWWKLSDFGIRALTDGEATNNHGKITNDGKVVAHDKEGNVVQKSSTTTTDTNTEEVTAAEDAKAKETAEELERAMARINRLEAQLRSRNIMISDLVASINDTKVTRKGLVYQANQL